MEGVFIPLAFFAAVALIVALTSFTAIHDREVQTRETLGRAEIEHRSRLAELDIAIKRLRQGG